MKTAAQKDSVSTVAWGTIASVARIGVTFVVWFFLTPLMIRALGGEAYGLWSVVFSLVGFLGLLDLGTGAGVVRCVAETRGHGRMSERNESLSTYVGAALLMSMAGVVVLASMSRWALPALGVPVALLETARVVLWLVGLRSFVLALPFGIVRGVLFGENRFIALNLAQAGATVLGGILTAVVLWNGGGVRGVAVAGLAIMLVEHLLYWRLAAPHLRGLSLSWRHVRWTTLKRAASLGAAQLVIATSGMVLLRTDPLIVQAAFGMSAVALYAVAMKVAENTFLVIKQFVNTLSPLIAEWHGAGERDRVGDLLVRATRLAGIPAALIGGAAIGAADPLLRLWLGPDFVAAALPMRILVLAMTLTVPQMVVFTVLTYTDRHHLPARASVVAAIANVAFSLLLIKPFGLAGVALGTLCATILVDVAYVLRAASVTFGLSFRDFARKALVPTWVPMLAQAAFLTLWFDWAPPANFGALALGLLAGGIPSLVLLGRVALDDAEKARLFRGLDRLRSAARIPVSLWRTV